MPGPNGSETRARAGSSPSGFLGAKVVTQQTRTVAPADLACVLHDVQEAAAEHWQRPRLARLEQPGVRQLPVAFRRQVHPYQLAQLAEAQTVSVHREQRSPEGADRLLPAADR